MVRDTAAWPDASCRACSRAQHGAAAERPRSSAQRAATRRAATRFDAQRVRCTARDFELRWHREMPVEVGLRRASARALTSSWWPSSSWPSSPPSSARTSPPSSSQPSQPLLLTLASLSPFEMFGLRALTTRAPPNDPERSFSCDERRHGPCLLRATLAPEPDAGARATPGHPVRLGPGTIAAQLFAASAAHAERGLRRRNADQFD